MNQKRMKRMSRSSTSALTSAGVRGRSGHGGHPSGPPRPSGRPAGQARGVRRPSRSAARRVPERGGPGATGDAAARPVAAGRRGRGPGRPAGRARAAGTRRCALQTSAAGGTARRGPRRALELLDRRRGRRRGGAGRAVGRGRGDGERTNPRTTAHMAMRSGRGPASTAGARGDAGAPVGAVEGDDVGAGTVRPVSGRCGAERSWLAAARGRGRRRREGRHRGAAVGRRGGAGGPGRRVRGGPAWGPAARTGGLVEPDVGVGVRPLAAAEPAAHREVVDVGEGVLPPAVIAHSALGGPPALDGRAHLFDVGPPGAGLGLRHGRPLPWCLRG